MTSARDTARQAYKLGVCTVPPKENGTKSPETERLTRDELVQLVGPDRAETILKGKDKVTTWKHWQYVRPSKDRMLRWYPDDDSRSGIGLVCGVISRCLELLEFDDYEIYQRFKSAAQAIGLGELVERIETGYLEETPGGGVHWFYHCDEVRGNENLASRPGPPDKNGNPTVETLIQTRGEGGFAVIAPSNGRVHPSGGTYQLISGGFDSIVTITPQERDALWELARTFDESRKTEYKHEGSNDPSTNRPGDDFNQRTTWRDVLEPHGWTFVYQSGETEYIRRPGKEDPGISATINGPGVKPDRLYVFSTGSVFPIPSGREGASFDKFGAFAILSHNGDLKAAARDLSERGYGEQPINFTRTDEYVPPESQQWPEPLDVAALHGLAGEIVNAIDPTTEADSTAVLMSLLTAVGNAVGSRPHWHVSGRDHGLRINTVMVGQTSKGRKGTAWGSTKPILRVASPEWLDNRIASGLSSGEGLIWAVRDSISKTEPIREKKEIIGYQEVQIDPGVDDKRLLVIEEEFSGTLRVMAREGSTLSAIIRQAWDDGDLRTLTKNSPAKATGAHISILGHTTQDELLRYLDSTETGNGFANRFIWVCVRRSKVLPHGGQLDWNVIQDLGAELRNVIDVGSQIDLIQQDDDTLTLWEHVYEELSKGKPGLMGAILSRAEAQVMRLAAIYAVLDCSSTIRPEHLRAALAVWEYAEASVEHTFGDALGDPVADQVLSTLRQVGPQSRTDLRDLFGRNVRGSRIDRALSDLFKAGKVRREREGTGGRPRDVWYAV